MNCNGREREREREGEGTTVRSPPPASRFGARCVWLKHRQTKTHLNREWENTMWALRLRWSIKENVWYSSQRANLFSSRLFPFPEFNVLQRKPVCYVYSCPVLVHHSLFSMCVCACGCFSYLRLGHYSRRGKRRSPSYDQNLIREFFSLSFATFCQCRNLIILSKKKSS